MTIERVLCDNVPMCKQQQSPQWSLADNLETLDRYWRRRSFHDAVIQEVTASNRRVLIRVGEWTLVILGATRLERCEFPTVWLSQKITAEKSSFRLDVETESGCLGVGGTDLRLIDTSDLTILIPPLDGAPVR